MRNALLRLSWLPLAAWLAGSWYVERFDGWGRWAAAPVLLPALVSSAVLGLAGIALLVTRWRKKKETDWPVVAATLLAASVVLSVWIRNVVA